MDIGEDAMSRDGQLYTTETLLGAWDRSSILSYAETLDARTFLKAWGEGIRVPESDETARARALHDHAITRALSRAVSGRRVVAFMGGHKLSRDSSTYRLVAECSRRLTCEGFLVVSGGGPGAMEATHLGARLARSTLEALNEALTILATVPTFPKYTGKEFVTKDGSFNESLLAAVHEWQAPAFEIADRWSGNSASESVGIPTWLYGHEPPTPLATSHAKYFENSVREDGLLAIAKAGVVFAEGSAGTLQEVFQDAAQNHYASVDDTRSPMVFLDLDEFWTVRRPVRLLLEGLLDEYAEELLHFVTTTDEVVAAITGCGSPPTPALIPGG